MNESYIAQRPFKVLQEQYDYIQELTKDLNKGHRTLFCHILASTFIQAWDFEDGFIPIPRSTIENSLGKGISHQTLKEAGLTILSPYNRELGRSFASKVRPEILERYSQLGDFELTSEGAKGFREAMKVNLFDGKPMDSPLPSEIRDINKHKHPSPISEALESLQGDLFNEPAILEHLRQSQTQYLQERDKRKRLRLQRRYENDLNCYRYGLLGQNPVETEKPGVFRYKPAYRVLSTGRIAVVGGGLQSCTREMKAAAYSNVHPTLRNYDISATQANILVQEIMKAGIEKEWLWQYLKDKAFKHKKAEEAGLSYDTWKECFYAIVMGASLPDKVKGKRGGAISKIFVEEYPILEERRQAYERFKTIIHPLWNIVDEWHRAYLPVYISVHSLPAIQPDIEKRYLPNKVNKKLWLSELPHYRSIEPQHSKVARKAQGKIAAHLLQGTEALFIHTLTSIAYKHGFQPLSNQHDGIVVKGEIPKAAIDEVKELTGLDYLEISVKEFV